MDLSLFLCLWYAPQKGYNHIKMVIFTQTKIWTCIRKLQLYMRSPDVSSFKQSIQGDHTVTEVLISSLSADIESRSD